jgi:hypothetical protein
MAGSARAGGRGHAPACVPPGEPSPWPPRVGRGARPVVGPQDHLKGKAAMGWDCYAPGMRPGGARAMLEAGGTAGDRIGCVTSHTETPLHCDRVGGWDAAIGRNPGDAASTQQPHVNSAPPPAHCCHCPLRPPDSQRSRQTGCRAAGLGCLETTWEAPPLVVGAHLLCCTQTPQGAFPLGRLRGHSFYITSKEDPSAVGRRPPPALRPDQDCPGRCLPATAAGRSTPR